jgi:hypothetical protein
VKRTCLYVRVGAGVTFHIARADGHTVCGRALAPGAARETTRPARVCLECDRMKDAASVTLEEPGGAP